VTFISISYILDSKPSAPTKITASTSDAKNQTPSLGNQSKTKHQASEIRAMEKQGGMAFGFWKRATAVIKPDRYIHFNTSVT
jgi:hypothetical protein